MRVKLYLERINQEMIKKRRPDQIAKAINKALEEKLASEKAAFCEYELNEMYTARESELL